jgi:ABC-type transport system substrate-binding protein
VSRFEPGRRRELEANPAYLRAGYPKCDGLVFAFGATPAEAAADLRSGRASLAWNLFPEDEAALRRSPEFAAGCRDAPLLQTVLLAFNVRRGPLADEAVRHHIVRSLDVEELVARAGAGLGVPAVGKIPPGLLGDEPSRNTTGPSLRPRPLARELGASCLMRPLFVEGSHAAFRAALFDALATLGVEARVADRPGPEWDAARDAAVDDMFLLGWTADYPDADAFTHGLLHSTHGWLGRFCGTPEIDRLIERSRTATDVDLRHDLCREVESLVARHALLLPLFNARTVRFARPEVRGLEVMFAPPFVAYDRIWVER